MFQPVKPESKALFNQTFQSLSPLYGAEEAREIAFIFVAHTTGLTRTEILINKRTENFDQEIYTKGLEKLIAEEPIQYVTGYTYFRDIKFFLDANVLIPRPETEEMVGLIIAENEPEPGLTILDLGTGSGCIPVSLKKAIPHAEVFAIDFSEAAIDIASRNAAYNDADIRFYQANMLDTGLSNLFKDTFFDIIVSNPPYVKVSEKMGMKANVMQYEPHMALFVPDDDPLLFYRAILEFSTSHLKPGGRIYFEINETLGNEIEQLMQKYRFKDIVIKKDFNNKVRFAKGTGMF